ncbi:MAG: ABC transporter ATP-binding protein/permease, partial [Clostridia bacterium]|nr:ABC transporter ATP-binding protein/permease [Clostridia bacterium]
MVKRFIAYYKPYKLLFVLDMLAALLMSFIGILYPVITRNMLNTFIPNRMIREIVFFGILLLFLYLVKMLLNYFIQYEGHVMGVHMQADMRKDLFCHLEKLSYTYFDNHETGKIMSRMTSDLMDVSELAHHGPENLIISVITIVFSFIYLSRIQLALTLIVFGCTPFLLLTAAVTRKRMKNAFKQTRESVAKINAAVESSITGIRVTKAYTNTDAEIDKFQDSNHSFVTARKDAYKAMGIFHSGTGFVTDVFNVVILIAGGFFLYHGKIDFGDYSAFIVSVNLFISPVMTLVNFMEQFQNGATGFERFLEIMDTEPEKDTPDAVSIGKAKGHISIENVSFSYTPDAPVLRDVSLEIPQGTLYALVGPSGGGKTTLCHLLPRFYEYTSGKITLDGQDIRHITMESLRRNIGIVQQDVFLFNSSVKENILYGRPDATFEEVVEAAKRANIHDFIMSLPNGYDSEIGERGVRLSGGQKQRLSIARVFLKDPAILILDEATSALDNSTEILIQESLDALCRGRTTLVVAHRLSTVKNANRI